MQQNYQSPLKYETNGEADYPAEIPVQPSKPTKQSASISYATASIGKTFGDAPFTNALTNTGDGKVTYATSNTAVATVNSETGEVTIMGNGEATITATVVGNAIVAISTDRRNASTKVRHFLPDSKFLGLSELAKITRTKRNESNDET